MHPPITSPANESADRPGRRLRRAGEACLWILVIGATVVAALHVAARLWLIVLPVVLALVLATFLRPPVRWLERHGSPRGAAAAAAVVAVALALGGIAAVLAPRVAGSVSDLDVSLTGGLERVEEWLATGPLPLNRDQAATVVGQVQETLNDQLGSLATGAVSGAILTLEVLAALALAVVLLFFFLKDGERLWRWLVELAPPARRGDIAAGGQRAWHALGGFLRGQTLVALFDAVFIGAGLIVLDVPLAFTLAVVTFFAAFVPLLGATLAGAAAALVALVAGGVTTALAVVALVLAVQQVEGNFFQPVVVGRAIDVHPVAILLGVTAGGVLGGILGAMLAAPAIAVAAAILGYLREPGPEPAGRSPVEHTTRSSADGRERRTRPRLG